MPRGLGFEITCDKIIRKDAFLFGEAQSRVVVSVKKSDEAKLTEELKKQGVPFSILGSVKGNAMKIDTEVFFPISEATGLYDTAIEKYLN